MKSDIRRTIQQAMRAAFPAFEDRVARFYAMQDYHLGWRNRELSPDDFDPGKLLRPQLVLLACEAVGGDPQQALPLAAGVQLIHDFTLIHDDIEDNSDTRRGRVTVWREWGLAQGINTGDGMFVIAHLALHQLAEAGVPAALALAVLRRFDETILRVCEGQFLDLSYEGNLTISTDDYLAMIGRKTAALVDGAAAMGALVGGADQATATVLGDFGRSLGLAFQIQDDLLGIWGDPELTGKPRAADLYRRKVSLPVVYALAHAAERAELAALYGGEGELDTAGVARALDILDSSGAQAATEALGAEHHAAALAALAGLPPNDSPGAAVARTRLLALAEGLVGRKA
jgi:geranylgeranyl diphosphate synthase, type I